MVKTMPQVPQVLSRLYLLCTYLLVAMCYVKLIATHLLVALCWLVHGELLDTHLLVLLSPHCSNLNVIWLKFLDNSLRTNFCVMLVALLTFLCRMGLPL